MDHLTLRTLVKQELLNSVWKAINKVWEESKPAKLNHTKFGERISGNHSWYTGALKNQEDITLTSFIRIIGELEEINTNKKSIPLKDIFTGKLLSKASLLNYLTSTEEDDSFLSEIIKENQEIFEDIKDSLFPIYDKKGLGTPELDDCFKELQTILNELERVNNG